MTTCAFGISFERPTPVTEITPVDLCGLITIPTFCMRSVGASGLTFETKPEPILLTYTVSPSSNPSSTIPFARPNETIKPSPFTAKS